MPPVLPSPAQNCPSSSLPPSSPAPSTTALSGCPSRLPPASPFCGRGQALLLLRVFVGVTRRPGPGPKSPHGATGKLLRPRMQPGKPARDRRRGKEPDFYTNSRKCIKFGVFNRYYTTFTAPRPSFPDHSGRKAARDGPRPKSCRHCQKTGRKSWNFAACQNTPM